MLGKLALTALIIGIVWLVFTRGTNVNRRMDSFRTKPARPSVPPIETLVECPACGSCRPAGSPCPCGTDRP